MKRFLALALPFIFAITAFAQGPRTATRQLSISVAAAASLVPAQAMGPLVPAGTVQPASNYFVVKGTTGPGIMLNGSHAWSDYQDQGNNGATVAVDFNGFVSFLTSHNQNATILQKQDLFQFCNWGAGGTWIVASDANNSPWQRTGPGTASDGLPKFDLTKFNQPYFDRLHARMLQLQNAGIYGIIELFDGHDLLNYRCGTTSPNGDGYPGTGVNNINGVDDGYTSGSSGGNSMVGSVLPWQQAYMQKVVDTVNDLQNVLYEACKEAPDDTWCQNMVNAIHTYQNTKPNQHPVLYPISNNFNTSALFNSNADLVAASGKIAQSNNCGTGLPACKVNLNDSDHSYIMPGIRTDGALLNRNWVWENFVSGAGGIMFQDPWDMFWSSSSRNLCNGGVAPANGICPSNSLDLYWEPLRNNLGYATLLSRKLNLPSMSSQSSLSSTTWCLANNSAGSSQFVVYAPNGGAFTVNLSAQAGRTLNYYWLDPTLGTYTAATVISGGSSAQSFTPPWGTSYDAVLYITDPKVLTVGPSACDSTTINNTVATAFDGDTILLTCTGSITWAGTVSVPNTKGLTIQVQGGTNTPKASANFPLIVTSNQSPAIQVDIGPNNSVSRVSGFRFAPNTGSANPFIQVDGMGNGNGIGGFNGGYRLDNNYFDTISAVENVAIWTCRAACPSTGGELYGLIDNNTFHNVWYAGNTTFGPYNIQIWNYWHPAGNNQCWGCDGWTVLDFAYGSEFFTFVEDNLFEQTATAPAHMRHYISSELGARYVSRYNTFNNNFTDQNADLHDAHGLCIPVSNGDGSRGGEIYNNTITGTGYNRGLQIRGGSWLIYNNVITPGGGNPIELNEYRASSSQTQCSTVNNMVLQPPWPVPAAATWSPNAPWIPAVSDGSAYQLPQQIFNTYSWNNKDNNNNVIGPVVPNDLLQTTYIQSNRDYFNSATQPAALGTYKPFTHPHPLRNATIHAAAACVGASPTWTSTPDQTSLQTCVNSAANGDTITILGGNATYSNTTVTISKGLVIKVATGQTVTLTTSAANDPAFFTVTGTGNNFVHISGDNGSGDCSIGLSYCGLVLNRPDDTGDNSSAILVVGPANAFRFDHILGNGGDSFIYSNNDSSATGPALGVIDHSYLENYGRTYFARDVRSTDNTSCGNGITAWNEFIGHENTFDGANKEIYFENNTFTWTHTLRIGSGQGAFYSIYGGKVVVRYSTFTHWSEQVTDEGDSPACGSVYYEIYNNTFTEDCNITGFGCEGKILDMRSGQSLIHDNTFTTTGSVPLKFINYPNGHPNIGHDIMNSFFWNNTWNGSACQSDSNPSGPVCVTVDSSSQSPVPTQNVNFFLRPPNQSSDVYFGYTPFTYPHPLLSQ